MVGLRDPIFGITDFGSQVREATMLSVTLRLRPEGQQKIVRVRMTEKDNGLVKDGGDP